MKLRRPQDEIVGCCWLARIADKVRASQKGDLPFLYRLLLGNPLGIDGYFLRHFGLSFPHIHQAVIDTKHDNDLAQWFLAQPGVTMETITKWNEYGPKLGTPSYPGSWFKHLAKWVVYPKSIKHPVDSFFDMIEQDEAG